MWCQSEKLKACGSDVSLRISQASSGCSMLPRSELLRILAGGSKPFFVPMAQSPFRCRTRPGWWHIF